MVRIEFDEFIRELSAYFERTKPPTQKTMELWYREVCNIPSRNLPLVMGEIKATEWPKNLPATMNRLSIMISEKNGDNQEYKIHDRRFHPDKWANKECKKCHGDGVVRTPMDWPVSRTEEGNLITKRIKPPVLCECTSRWEDGG